MTENRGLLLELEGRFKDLPGIAARLLEPLGCGQKPFCLWLVGPLGAGKTSVSGALLYALGLSRRIPVTSPTYAYLNEYNIEGKIWAHMDLYRLPEGSTLEELGLSPDHDFHGMLVEWPEKVSDRDLIKPDFILEIKRGKNPELRSYRLSRQP